MIVSIKDVKDMSHLKNFVFDAKTKGQLKKVAPVKCVVVSHPAFTLRTKEGADWKNRGGVVNCVTHFQKNEMVGAVYFISSDNLSI